MQLFLLIALLLHFQWQDSTKVYRYALVEIINEGSIGQRLKQKDDEQGLKNFIINALRNHLKTINSSPEKKNDLESYLKKGISGSRTYGVKGQGW